MIVPHPASPIPRRQRRAAKLGRAIEVYLEIGSTRVFAGAMDWPGWCRNGKGEAGALAALFAYAPRYARALKGTSLGFSVPADGVALVVVERLKGNATTDFGAPDASPSSDVKPVSARDLKRLQDLLEACWRTFDASVKAAKGKVLTLGPRGGGRDLQRIVDHVVEAEAAYLRGLGVAFKMGEGPPAADMRALRKAILDGLASSARGEIPARGPRGQSHRPVGGVRWTPRYFVRRAAWHVLDHAWEIEDRAKG